MMSRGRLCLLLVACCSSLTCQASGQKAVKTTTQQPKAISTENQYEPTDSNCPPEEWVRRTLTDSKRVDLPTARLAVSSVATSEPRPLLRVDTTVLGAGEWPAAVLSYGGLTVRRQDSYLLIEASRPDGMKPALRDTLAPIHEAIERIRGNLLTQKVAGQRAVAGQLERLIASHASPVMSDIEGGIRIDFSQGPVTETGQALDLAIQGKGLFSLEYQDGEHQRRLYTRDGRFKMRKDGVLVSRAMPRAKLVPEITLPLDTSQVAVSAGGAVLTRSKIMQALGERGRISLTWFEHPEKLTSPQPGFFIRTPEAGAVTEGNPTESTLGSLQQGSVEGSNVNLLENWTRLCLLEDARRLVLAMLTELEEPSGSTLRVAETRMPRHGGVGGRARTSSTITVPLDEVRYDACESTLLTFLRLRGTDVWVGPDGAELQRCPETASSLVQYLQFLRQRLNAVAENIANASRCAAANGTSEPYRRQFVKLRDDGEPEVVEDTSPLRVVAESLAEAGDKSGAKPRLVEYPNVDLDSEMAESDAVSQEYRRIRDALREMGRDAVPALTDVLRTSAPEMRLDAASVLGQIGPEASAAVPSLVEALGADSWEVRERATNALERIASDSDVVSEAIVRTWTAALRSTNASRRCEAAARLGRMGRKAASAVAPLIELLDDPTSGAARALGKMGPAAAPAVPALVGALQHCEVHVRQQAADALGRIGAIAHAAAPALIEAMKDENAEVRWRAAAAIGSIGANDSGCIAALAGLLKDEDADVRDHVAEALGRLGSSTMEVQGLLEKASRAASPRDRIWPSFALAITGRKPASFVLSLGTILLTDERTTRLATCEALRKLGPLAVPAVPLLTELLAGRDKAVVAAAMDALGAIGPAAAGAVPRLSIALGDRDPFIRRRTATALGQIGEAAAVAAPALVSQLHDENEPVVAACVEALGKIGPHAGEAKPMLQQLRGHPSAAVRSAVAVSLSQIGESGGRGLPVASPQQTPPQAVAGGRQSAGEP